MKRYMLTEPGFIAATLLLAGSIVTEADLGKKTVPVLDKDNKPTGKTEEVQVAPPSSAIEVDENGVPKTDQDADMLAQIVANTEGIPIAAVQPHAPNPTKPQGAPAQPAGLVQAVERQLATEPAEGVESNEAAAARAEQKEAAVETATAISEKTEAPKRRKK